MGFKNIDTPHPRWIGCLEGDKCYSWGCPQANFSNTWRCPSFVFTITPADYPLDPRKPPILSGSRVVLKQYSFLRSVFIPLHCSGPSRLCLQSNDPACFSYLWPYPPANECQQQVFEIFATEKSIGEPISHKDQIVLLDISDQPSSKGLFCNTTASRKRKRTCQIKSCNGTGMESCSDPRHRFTVYKL